MLTQEPVQIPSPEELRIKLDQDRLALDQRKFESDRLLQQRKFDWDRRIKKHEIRLQHRGLTAPRATAIGAFIALAGVLGGAFWAANTAIKTEYMKFQTQLITNAYNKLPPAEAGQLLDFYAAQGFIPDFKHIVSQIKSGYPEKLPTAATEPVAVTAASVTEACEKNFDPKLDAAVFVRIVAQSLSVTLGQGNATEMISELQAASKEWIRLRDGLEAAERAQKGDLVIAGLPGSLQSFPSPHSLVVVIVDGPLAGGKYPTAYWTNPFRPDSAGKFRTINFAWNASDRDKVMYFSRHLSIGPK